MTRDKVYDVIVVGGGHAGCEASLAASRMGCSTLLITMHRDRIGFMSCNPAIGGVGKGQLVKEIDALGGEMARASDTCGIQFRTLNTSKGPAVWSSRAQVDRKRYSLYMQEVVMNQKGIDVHEGEVVRIIVNDKVVKGVETSKGERIQAKAVVITPGTFLNGLIHIGMRSFAGGRIEEKESAEALSNSLRDLGFRILRFKTGTCARLDGKTIDFSKLDIQNGDNPPKPFSFSTSLLNINQVHCFTTYTNEKTHSIIRKNLDRSPLYSGKISGTGVRYCPSLEDKVVKFPHHQRHLIFLEPEGRDTDDVYPNGISTSLPEDVQEDFIHSIPGLENVKINRFGYGIEHDAVDSTHLFSTLEAKLIQNLYLAGQINGSTGYEEAASQGLIAGINASLKVKGKAPLILDRSTSYIGVLIDDLVTRGTNEPYRMFTSRVEYRLVLREDNADLRLRRFGFEIGLVNKEVYENTLQKGELIQNGIRYLSQSRVSDNGREVTLYQLLKRPEVRIRDLLQDLAPVFKRDTPEDVLRGIEIEVKYSGFIERQLTEVKNFNRLEKIRIPPGMDFNKISGLSSEIREKLFRFRPINLGQASRISGVTPVAIIILMVYIKKNKRPVFIDTPNPKSKYQKPKAERYYKFSRYLRERFGTKVYKVSIDGGFSCPNKDGRLSKDGCIYCDNRVFSFNTRISTRPIEAQIREGMTYGRKRYGAQKFIVYFQAYTNTYAPLDVLKERYDIIRKFKDIAGIAIGTRPDCINEEILDLIQSYTRDYEVWVEYGLQSIHKKTLEFINRAHLYEDFLNGVKLTRKKKDIKICAHVIIGLPNETKKDILETAKELGHLKLDGIKLHPLHIIRGTRLEEFFKNGVYKPLEMHEYVDVVTDFLEYISPVTIIQRITADSPKEFLVSPLWVLEKNKVLDEIEDVLLKKDRFQGRLYDERIEQCLIT